MIVRIYNNRAKKAVASMLGYYPSRVRPRSGGNCRDIPDERMEDILTVKGLRLKKKARFLLYGRRLKDKGKQQFATVTTDG